MRKQLLIGAGMCFATVALIFAGSARAEPPEAMTYRSLPTPVVACDTREEMGQVVQAVRDGKLKEKLVEMASIKDEHNEPVCIYSPLSAVVFGESEHIGRIRDHDKTIDSWIVHVGNQHMDFYVLWGELVPETGA